MRSEPAHPLARATSFEHLGAYRLRVRFGDGSEREIDFEPVLSGELFGPLRQPDLFRQVLVDPESHTLVWLNGADFDPATLRDWPEHAEELARRARSWRS